MAPNASETRWNEVGQQSKHQLINDVALGSTWQGNPGGGSSADERAIGMRLIGRRRRDKMPACHLPAPAARSGEYAIRS